MAAAVDPNPGFPRDPLGRLVKNSKTTVTTTKGECTMKAIYSIFLMVAAAALLALSVPVPAFSQMMDMSMNEHREGHGQMMEMGNMDKMGDMTRTLAKYDPFVLIRSNLQAAQLL